MSRLIIQFQDKYPNCSQHMQWDYWHYRLRTRHSKTPRQLDTGHSRQNAVP